MKLRIMCDAPILIRNPNFRSPVKDPTFHNLHDTIHEFMPVPCGRCATCIHLRQIYMVQRVQMEALSNDLFYGTLTYNQDSLPIAQFGDIRFAYPDYSDWQKMIKMIRKDYPNLSFRYLLVSEYGGKKHRPHYHFILSLPRTSDFFAEKWSKANELFRIFLKYWRRNYGSTRTPIWKPLCNYVRRGGKYNYDLHWLDPTSSKDGLDGVSFYVTKYVLKYDEWVDKFKSKLFFSLSDDDFKVAYDLFKPRCLFSKGFGSSDDPKVRHHIYNGIDFSLADSKALFPYYISVQNGSTYPLCPYYRKKFLDVDSSIVFRDRCANAPDKDAFSLVDDFEKRNLSMNLAKSYLNSQSLLIDFDDIDGINSQFINDLSDYGKNNKNSYMASISPDSWEDF